MQHPDAMKVLLHEICEDHRHLESFCENGNKLLLSELTETERENFLRLAVNYFDYNPVLLDLSDPFEKLQIWIKTGDAIDKEILAEKFRDTMQEFFAPQMQILLNDYFDNYMREKEYERRYEKGWSTSVDDQTGEIRWNKK